METRDPRMEMSALGDFMLEEVLGRGGMGIVYRARRLSTGQPVALKLMIPELAGDEEFRERFVREGEFAPSLDHPNIVPVYEFGEVSGELYIAMQLIDGCDLKELIKAEGPLGPQRTVQIIRQAASALDAAHEMGVIHRDVKPQNILITPGSSEESDLAYVSDFGLIRPIVSHTSVSRTGQVFGSVPYMAPELIEGLAADGRADVYSLGCVIYEALTGRVPYERDSEIAVVWAHIHEDPPKVSTRRTDVAPGVDDVVIRALSKHPDDRYLTCGEMVDDLEAGLGRRLSRLTYAHMRPLVERIPRKKTEREIWAPNFFPELSRVRKITNKVNWVQTAAVATTLAVGAAALVHFSHPGGITAALDDAARGVGESVAGLFRRDGDRPEDSGVSARTQTRPLTAEEPFARGRQQRDEKLLEERPAGDLEPASSLGRDPVNAGTAERRTGASPVSAILFAAPDGHHPLNRSHALYTVRPDGRKLRILYNSDADEYEATWSPDGSKVAFIRGSDIYVMNVDGTGLRQITSDAGWQRQPTWSPDGRRLAYSYSPLPPDSPSGSHDWQIYVADLGNNVAVPQRITNSTGANRHPDWSPDGSRIAFSSTRDGTERIYMMNPDGSGVKSLVNARSMHPRWAPDGRRIAFVTTGTGHNQLKILDLASSGIQSLPCRDTCLWPAWSPDGSELVYTDIGSRGTRNVYVRAASGASSPRKVIGKVADETKPAWRPR